MHGQHDVEVLELAPQGVELRQSGVAPVPEAGADGGGLEPALGHPAELLDRVLDALDGQDRAGEEPAPVGGAVIVDPVVVGAGQHTGGLGIPHEGQPHEPRREEHDLVGAEGVHVAQPRVRIATAGHAPEFPLPLLRARHERADLLLAPARPADLCGIGPLPGGGDDAPVDVEQVGVGVEVKLRLHPRPDAARDVLVPDLRRLHDMAIAVEHGEILAGHDRPPSSLACRTRMKLPPRDPRLPAKISQPARPINRRCLLQPLDLTRSSLPLGARGSSGALGLTSFAHVGAWMG